MKTLGKVPENKGMQVFQSTAHIKNIKKFTNFEGISFKRT
jgi:hypothetical protein